MRTRGAQTEYIASPLDSVAIIQPLTLLIRFIWLGVKLTDTWQSDDDVAALIVREGLRDTPAINEVAGRRSPWKARKLREIARKAWRRERQKRRSR